MEKKMTLIQRIWGKNTKTTPEEKQTTARIAGQKAVLEALKAGEHIDMTDATRFKVCDMHSTISKVRRMIEQQKLPYVICSEWKTFNEDGFRCKEYWLEKI